MNESANAVITVVAVAWMAVHPLLALWSRRPVRVTFRVGRPPGP